jgi:oxygen-independent coproporphyrinogen-3 oxidase
LGGPLPEGDPAPLDGSLPADALLDQSNRSFHAYVHVPFCSVRCGYCDFNTYTSDELKGYSPNRFVEHLQREVSLAQQVVGDAGARKLSSVFFGGGTPTKLPAADLAAALAKLENAWGLADGCEVTVEANPDTVDELYLSKLAKAGVTRVSVGMQSAVSRVLKVLDRTHNPENVRLAVEAAKRVGLQTSVDLIYGAPGETLDDWKATVEQALSLETDHISAYALIVESGTKLAGLISRGALEEPDEELEVDKYNLADATFSSAGFEWYELSNWSRSEQTQSLHNRSYWTGQDWWGFGPGAHSHFGGVRWWNVKHPTTYAAALDADNSPAAAREFIDAHTRLVETLMLQIRLREGVSTEVAKQLSERADAIIAGAIADELVDAASALRGRLVLTLKGRMLADALVRSFLE